MTVLSLEPLDQLFLIGIQVSEEHKIERAIYSDQTEREKKMKIWFMYDHMAMALLPAHP